MSIKRVLILSYFFPPANFVGGDRIYSWAKHLSKFGYYPVIITRTWNPGQKDLTDHVTDNNFKHEKYDTYEVFRIPHQRSLRDKLHTLNQSLYFTMFRKALSLLELIIGNFTLRLTPYNEIYKFALNHLHKNKNSYSCIIASGRPFQLFFVAHKLQSKIGVKWIADYRDEWNTFQNKFQNGILHRIVQKIEARSELRWTRSAVGFITVSEYWKASISAYIHKIGYVVMNGYEPVIRAQTSKTQTKRNEFNIYYIGTLYPVQCVEVFITAFKKVCKQLEFTSTVKVHFVGITSIPEQATRVKELSAGFEDNIIIYDRIPKEEVQNLYDRADLLLAISYQKIKGWYPVKIFEYYSQNIPVLLCPNDHDVMQDFVTKTGCGFVVDDEEACLQKLKQLIMAKLNGESLSLQRNASEAAYYTRENQARILSEAITKLTE